MENFCIKKRLYLLTLLLLLCLGWNVVAGQREDKEFAWGGATELYSGQRATVESGAVTFPTFSNKVAILKAD